MALTKSAVYECLRIEPPVPYQYGRAKEDFEIQSHESTFLIKKGEMLFGYEPIVTKDPKIFADSEEFVAERFVGEGERLIRHVYWSNERETEDPTAENKQCPGKDLVVLMCRLMLVEFFLRYDTFEVEIGKIMLESSVTFKSLTKMVKMNSVCARASAASTATQILEEAGEGFLLNHAIEDEIEGNALRNLSQAPG